MLKSHRASLREISDGMVAVPEIYSNFKNSERPRIEKAVEVVNKKHGKLFEIRDTAFEHRLPLKIVPDYFAVVKSQLFMMLAASDWKAAQDVVKALHEETTRGVD